MKVKSSYAVISALTLVVVIMVYAQKMEEGYVYVVKPGDTLWDISARFLNNPWLWPKVWEQNRYITNPHLIFPGDPIAIGITPPAVAIAPTPAQVPAPPVAGAPAVAAQPALTPEEMAAAPGATAAAPPPSVTQGEGLTEEEMTATAEEAPEESIGEVAKIEEVGEGNIYYSSAASVSFITPEELEASGSIVGSKLERKMFGQHDEIYVSLLGETNVGDRFTVFRTEGKLKHPVSGETLGYRIRNLGEVEITEVEKEKEIAKAKIVRSSDVIKKGDKLIPVESLTSEIILKSSEQQIEGYIVASQDDLKLLGEGQVVYIDKGTSDGIIEGNVFTIFRPGKLIREEITGKEVESPVEIIGKIVIVKARENVSTALITKSKKEISIGDHIVSEVF